MTPQNSRRRNVEGLFKVQALSGCSTDFGASPPHFSPRSSFAGDDDLDELSGDRTSSLVLSGLDENYEDFSCRTKQKSRCAQHSPKLRPAPAPASPPFLELPPVADDFALTLEVNEVGDRRGHEFGPSAMLLAALSHLKDAQEDTDHDEEDEVLGVFKLAEDMSPQLERMFQDSFDAWGAGSAVDFKMPVSLPACGPRQAKLSAPPAPRLRTLADPLLCLSPLTLPPAAAAHADFEAAFGRLSEGRFAAGCSPHGPSDLLSRALGLAVAAAGTSDDSTDVGALSDLLRCDSLYSSSEADAAFSLSGGEDDFDERTVFDMMPLQMSGR